MDDNLADLRKYYKSKKKLYDLLLEIRKLRDKPDFDTSNKDYKKLVEQIKKEKEDKSIVPKEFLGINIEEVNMSKYGLEVDINPDDQVLVEIFNHLLKLQKFIEQKENRIEQNKYLKQQQEYMYLQKIDIKENKKNRELVSLFTFILALGVIASILYYISTIVMNLGGEISQVKFIIVPIIILLVIGFVYTTNLISRKSIMTKYYIEDKFTNFMIILLCFLLLLSMILGFILFFFMI